LEALFTFFLVSAVYGTCVSSQAQRVGGFAIGLVVLVCALGGGGVLTGAVMNPARAFGPALVSWDWHAQAVYWIGPLLGAAAAAGLWRYLLLPPSATDLR
jgi:aquaporin Z